MPTGTSSCLALAQPSPASWAFTARGTEEAYLYPRLPSLLRPPHPSTPPDSTLACHLAEAGRGASTPINYLDCLLGGKLCVFARPAAMVFDRWAICKSSCHLNRLNEGPRPERNMSGEPVINAPTSKHVNVYRLSHRQDSGNGTWLSKQEVRKQRLREKAIPREASLTIRFARMDKTWGKPVMNQQTNALTRPWPKDVRPSEGMGIKTVFKQTLTLSLVMPSSRENCDTAIARLSAPVVDLILVDLSADPPKISGSQKCL
ncbi:unnamed protein product [Protopolystoma xenopodis]|uniref:Uncharacterized protein n=1 Tax=Protopolystoma xenopodis TaxID=117903 RepID=A0A3S5C6Z4_9PLAT|nr:unnamed protein product [Protopolystoma xenopodis]